MIILVILITLMILLGVTLVIGVAAMGSKQFCPAFKIKVMRVRLALYGLAVPVLGLLILSGI